MLYGKAARELQPPQHTARMNRMSSVFFFLIVIIIAICTENFILCKQSDDAKAKKKITESVEISYDGEDMENGHGKDVLRGIEAGRQSQSRFDLIDQKGVNRAGVRDLSLGKKGNSIIRVDSGANTGRGNHIKIDPRGYPTSKNPRIPLPPGSTATIAAGQRALQYGMRGLSLVNTAVNVIDMVAAMGQDYSDSFKKEDNINKLEKVIREINDELWNNRNLSGDERDYLVQVRQKCKLYLDQLKRYKSVPEKSIRAGASLAGATYGGFWAGSACATAGAKIGSVVGLPFGPFAPVFTITGTLYGAYKCGMFGAQVGSEVGEGLANAGMEAIVGQKVNFTVKV